MAAFKNRQDSPSPDVRFQEIAIADDWNPGFEGTFTFETRKGSLGPTKTIVAAAVNPGAGFEVEMRLVLEDGVVVGHLGRANGAPPVNERRFLLPVFLQDGKPHRFMVSFRKWRIASCAVDGAILSDASTAPREGTVSFWARHPQSDWWNNTQHIELPVFEQGGVRVEARKYPDASIEIAVTILGTGTATMKGAIPKPDERGVFVAVTWEDGIVKLYLGGVLVDTKPALNSIAGSSGSQMPS